MGILGLSMKDFQFVYLHPEYAAFLCQKDREVLFNKDKEGKSARPYIGIVFTHNDGFKYVAPLTSKEKKERGKYNIPVSGREYGGIGVILCGKMVPVSAEVVIPLDMESISKDNPKYAELLRKQMRSINAKKEKEIRRTAQEAYKFRYTREAASLSFSPDFKRLENELLKYSLHRLGERTGSKISIFNIKHRETRNSLNTIFNNLDLDDLAKLNEIEKISAQSSIQFWRNYIAKNQEKIGLSRTQFHRLVQLFEQRIEKNSGQKKGKKEDERQR